MKRVFSGIQPTGSLHIGNYLGAIRNWVSMQYEYESFFCIVDYHAITIPYEPSEMAGRILDTAATNLAAGLDPERCTLFVQSHVPEHTELCWLLNAVTPVGNLQRMHQFKEKSRQHPDHINAGLLNYPILQAADILLYKAHLVPVGEDQVQHIELTRDIARRFNHTFAEILVEPEAYLPKVARIMALNDPEKKMSKSIPGSTIGLADEPEEIRRKLARAVTDTGPRPDGQMSPGVRNLFNLLEAFAPEETVQHFREEYDAGTLRYSDLKAALAEAIIAELAPLRERRAELLSKPSYIWEVLDEGAERARAVARRTLREVKEAMGLLRPGV